MSTAKNKPVPHILNELKSGTIISKRKHGGEKYDRRYFLDGREQFVSYQSEKAFTPPYRYYIEKIDEVRTGFNSRTFDRLFRHNSVKENDKRRAFSLFYNNYRDELHLVADQEETRDMWVGALRHLMDKHAQQRQRHVINETNWIMNYFCLADKDGSNTLTKQECRKLLTDLLNVKVSEDVFKKLFKEADRSGEGVLTSDEFVHFFHLLNRRKDLYQLMQKYVKNGERQPIETISMTSHELLRFLQDNQKQTEIKERTDQSKDTVPREPILTDDQVQDLINEHETDDNFRERNQLSLNGFRNLLLSDEFSLMKPWCSQNIYQDMTRPLSDYYIKTSHNTYLFNNQLSGNSNPEAYNRALRAGCRAVEIDCYDGDSGRPIVKHGYTLVKPCLFESIIRFIEPNLFKTSPYPVILDLENHCSIEQQHEMARILRRVFGDRLISDPLSIENSSVLPSPEDLKYKVLVRVIEHSLADLFIYFQNVPFREHELATENQLCCHSPNLAEKHFDRATRVNPTGVIKQTQKSSLRMYPDGLRQDSSNPNPIHPWNFGIQMVALNYQNDDAMMSLAYGKFLDNGGCGYVLKPQYLTDSENNHFNPYDYLTKPLVLPEAIHEFPQRLIITIISGQLLPRSSETTTDIPDPYVIISTHGIACDQQSKQTKVIQNNGFDPMWNETFRFDVTFPQMCLVRFDVYDYDRFTKDDRLAYFCLPMTTIQTGYRHIHLRATNNKSIYSTLFVHVELEDI